MLDKVKRYVLMNLRVAFHKYTSCWYIDNIETRLDYEETYKANSKMAIPTYDEMKKTMFEQMSLSGFKFVVSSPKKANCAVRIYRKELEIEGVPGGLCGAVCFVKNSSGKWMTTTEDGNEVEMTYDDTFEVKYWTSLLTQHNEPVKANYYDVYLRVIGI